MADVNAVINELKNVVQIDEEVKSNISECRFQLTQNAQQLSLLKKDLNRTESKYSKTKGDLEINKFLNDYLMECNENLRTILKQVWSDSQKIQENLEHSELEKLNENYDKNVIKFENWKKLSDNALKSLERELKNVQDSIEACEQKRELEIQQQLIETRNLQVELNRVENEIEKQEKLGELIKEDIKLCSERTEEIRNIISSIENEKQEMIDEKSLLLKNIEQLEMEYSNNTKQILDNIRDIENEKKSVAILIEGLTKTFSKNQQFYKGLEEEYVEIKDTNNGLHMEVNGKQELLNELQKHCAELSQFTEVQLQAKEELINNHKMLLLSETLARDKILNDIEIEQDSLKKCNVLINNLQTEISNIKETTENVSKESLEMNDKNQAVQNDIDKILLEIEENKRNFTANESVFKELTLQKDSNMSEIETSLKEMLLKFENEEKLLQDEISEINETYTSTRQEIKTCEQRRREIESEIKEVENNIVRTLAESRQNALRQRQESERSHIPLTPKRKSPPRQQDDSESSVDERFESWKRKMKRRSN